MPKAIRAIMFGEDYQARVFWLEAIRLFQDRTKVTRVEIEPENIKSIDDVATHYSRLTDFRGNTIKSDYYQVKFHMAADGALTCQAMMDPAFIGATSISLLQRMAYAQARHAPNGTEARFTLYTPWTVAPQDPLGELVSRTDGSLRWEVLAQGGERSVFGKVRKAWRDHLELASDEDLQLVIQPVRFEIGPSLERLDKLLNDGLAYVGLRPVAAGEFPNPYDGLAWEFVKNGRSSFTRGELEQVCKRAGLWVGQPTVQPDERRLGIRSFLRFAEHIEDETDQHLCLLKYFEGRRISDTQNWCRIAAEVDAFLRNAVVPGATHVIYLHAHGSIAYAAGYAVNPKAGIHVGVFQPGNGRQVWRPAPPGGTTSGSMWLQESMPLRAEEGEVAVALSVTHDIKSDVGLYVKDTLPAVARILHFHLPTPGPGAVHDGAHASLLAQHIAGRLKTDRTPKERSRRLHLFFAAPNALVFFLGQLGHAFGPTTVYEYDFESNTPGAYTPAIALPSAP